MSKILIICTLFAVTICQEGGISESILCPAIASKCVSKEQKVCNLHAAYCGYEPQSQPHPYVNRSLAIFQMCAVSTDGKMITFDDVCQACKYEQHYNQEVSVKKYGELFFKKIFFQIFFQKFSKVTEACDKPTAVVNSFGFLVNL